MVRIAQAHLGGLQDGLKERTVVAEFPSLEKTVAASQPAFGPSVRAIY
jgi:hypothetical protein